VPAARHECRRAQRRVKDGALAPPPGLSLMHASTTACSRGTGLDTSQLPPINYLGSRPFGSVILLTHRQSLPWGDYESPGRNDSERKCGLERSRSEGRACSRRAKAAWGAEIWLMRHSHLGGVKATAR